MMLLITYDLKVPKDYTPFYEALKAQGQWWHYITSTWIIDTLKTPDDILAAVRPHLSPQDFLFVTELGLRHQGLLPREAWDWINTRLNTQNINPFLPFAPPASLQPGK
jgi:hypothetical protein